MSTNTINGLTIEDWQRIAVAKDEAVADAVSILDAIRDAYAAETNWEQFGRDVHRILHHERGECDCGAVSEPHVVEPTPEKERDAR